jgi:hypothetical protein
VSSKRKEQFEKGGNKMSNRIRVVLGAVLAVLPLVAQATPVDVNGDGKVGPQEAIDLSQSWKGPALPQTWQVNGTNIFYNAGSVGIGTSAPDVRFQVNDGRIRIRESATLERWDLFYDPPSQKFWLQENATFNHIVFTKGPDSRVGIGTDDPEIDKKLEVFQNGFFGEGIYGTAVFGKAPYGVGVRGQGKIGVSGSAFEAGQVAIQGEALPGALAGRFMGDIDVSGNVLKSVDSSRIDHPLDPANKYLFHSSVESSDMKNIYDGNVVTDATGYAKVTLPDWFEALNKDFRYQLTVLDDTNSDAFVQAKVVKKIEGNQFTIRTSHPNVEVSWQVTGVRQDAYAKANPIEVEKIKPDGERGKYVTPEVFGQPKEMGIGYRPEMKASSASDSKGE